MKALISAAKLKQQLADVQLFEVGARTADATQAELSLQQYLSGHIPGAQYVDLSKQFCNLCTQLDYQHPSGEEMLQSIQHFNIPTEQPIVIYDRENHIWATRLWWVLTAYGFQNVYVLHGGLNSWLQQGYVLQSGQTRPGHKQYVLPEKLSFNPDLFADQNEVQQVVAGKTNVQLLNVLRPVVFSGQELRYTRKGHIPTSINIPFASFLDERGHFKDLTSSFVAEFGLDLNREIIIYCGSGITASGAAFALLHKRVAAVRIYDGSMSEWSADPDLPLTVLV